MLSICRTSSQVSAKGGGRKLCAVTYLCPDLIRYANKLPEKMTVIFRLLFPLMGRTHVCPNCEMSLWLFLCIIKLYCIKATVFASREKPIKTEELCHWVVDIWEHTVNKWCNSDSTESNDPVFLNFPSDVLYLLALPVHAYVCIWPILRTKSSVCFFL